MAFLKISFIILIIVSLLYFLSFIISMTIKDIDKFSSYECGFEPIYSNARLKFDILYWIIAILYLIFDLELIFIFPYSITINQLDNFISYLIYLFFILILTIGFIYEWQKGALKLK